VLGNLDNSNYVPLGFTLRKMTGASCRKLKQKEPGLAMMVKTDKAINYPRTDRNEEKRVTKIWF
jgi:hypothetical protein